MRRPVGWQWDPSPAGRTTIVVTDPGDEAKAERKRKIDAGADVVPFGFGRVLHERTIAPVVDDEDAWEGMGL